MGVLKLIGVILVIQIALIAYKFIYKPYRLRQYYMKFKNIYIPEKFVPMAGDVALVEENHTNGRNKIQHFFETADKLKNTDMRLVQYGDMSILGMCSVKAVEQLEALIPSKVDIYNHHEFPIANIAPGLFIFNRTNDDTLNRRKTLMKLLGFNKVSQYIPVMITTVDDILAKSDF